MLSLSSSSRGLGTDSIRSAAGERQDPVKAKGIEFFENKIRPVLSKYCYECHSAQSTKVRGGLLLDSKEGMLKGGDSGPALVPGKAKDSLFIKALRHEGDLQMPPRSKKLDDDVIADFVRWIDMGAPDPRKGKLIAAKTIDIDKGRKFWSFQPLAQATPPTVKNQPWVRTDVDRFILAKLEANGLTPNQPTSRERLLRRAYFDLLGLPPTPAEIEAFLSDAAPIAYEKLIDQLLESKHFGERWGRHWLDVVRFGESGGYEYDKDRPHAYHYRDFVIKAFNQDIPFDQFVRWQIAGDHLEPKDAQAVAATGFLVAGPFNGDMTSKTQAQIRYNHLDDMISTLSSSLLGLTVGCARCHAHKHDPIPQEDYYRLIACLSRTDSDNVKLPGVGPIFAATSKKGGDIHFLIRGEPEKKGAVMTPGFLQVLMNAADADQHWTGKTEPNKRPATPSRVALANWITDVDHGAGRLLARVIVNRLWQHHMGRGIVGTANDFGTQGEPPTHPELLDYLARELINNGWKLKPIHKLIMTSAVYMQAGEVIQANMKSDPQNRLWWRRPGRRLEAEAIRDAILAVAGILDPKMYGPGTLDGNSPRRSVYLTVKRSQLNPLLQMFDAPEPIQSVGERNVTTVPTQSLAFLNSPFVRQAAAKVAGRIRSKSPETSNETIDLAYLTVLSRRPTETERNRMKVFLQRQTESYGNTPQARDRALADGCHVLLCLNEFIFVD